MTAQQDQTGKTLTPWGFYLEDAFALFRMQAGAKASAATFRASQETRLREQEQCAVGACKRERKPRWRYCPEHAEKVKQIRERRARANFERLARQREEDRRERMLQGLARRQDEAELREVRKIVCDLKRQIEAARPRRRYNGPTRPGFVYRLFDDSGALLYVGKTYSVQSRLFTGASCHSTTKNWFAQAVLAKVAVFATEADALEAEAWAIQQEAPRYNVATPKPHETRAPRPLAVYEGALEAA